MPGEDDRKEIVIAHQMPDCANVAGGTLNPKWYQNGSMIKVVRLIDL